jgi:hypothetical protein
MAELLHNILHTNQYLEAPAGLACRLLTAKADARSVGGLVLDWRKELGNS